MEMKTKAEALESMRSLGYCILSSYWPREKCQEAIKEVSSLPLHFWEQGQGGDLRCQHSNKHLKSAREFLNDPFIQEIANEYSACNSADRTLAGVLEYKKGVSKDSGGGWHMDSLEAHQFKSILYISDTGPNNGPFAFVQKSKEASNTVPTYSNLRISEETIRDTFKEEDVLELSGPAGTCILADTTFPHCGRPIKEGVRYSYTVYFYDR